MISRHKIYRYAKVPDHKDVWRLSGVPCAESTDQTGSISLKMNHLCSFVLLLLLLLQGSVSADSTTVVPLLLDAKGNVGGSVIAAHHGTTTFSIMCPHCRPSADAWTNVDGGVPGTHIAHLEVTGVFVP